MRITLHDYLTDPSLSQKDGVNLAHENIAALLKDHSREHMAVAFHDMNRLLADEAYAREILGAADCVISNVGPHAHYYFHLREKLGLDFRIFRDVRTAIWSSYLLQEHLCQPYLREEDVLLVASHYTRAIYEKFFPHLKSFGCLRCYPLTVAFPVDLPPRPAASSVLNLGYIGRLSEDKNFPDLIRLLIALNKSQPGKYRLLACGDVHSASCSPDEIRRHLHNELGEGDFFEYFPPRGNSEIWEIYQRFDVMLFPSTSNLETLGRVLIEASYAGVPIICGEHAAAPELVPPASLCRVNYKKGVTHSAHYDHSLGHLDIEDMIRAVTSPSLAAASCHLDYQQHPQKLLDTLEDVAEGKEGLPEPYELTSSQRAFIESLEIDLPAPLALQQADELVAALVPWFLDLQAKNTVERQHRLSELLGMSKHPERTARFIEKSGRTSCDFTNVGGIDIELCHIAGFYPRFVLK